MSDSTSIDQFVQITGADEATARFFLSAANGNCDAAVSAFFESDGMIPSGAAAPPSTARPISTSSRPPISSTPVNNANNTANTTNLGSAGASSQQPQSSSSSSSQFPQQPSSSSAFPSRSGVAGSGSRRRTPAGSSSGRIATLGSLERERDDDEKGYYAGGEKSGQIVQDPRKHNNNNNNHNGDSNTPMTNNNDERSNNNNNDDQPQGLADAILERARSRGPRTDEERAEFEGPQRFSGAGYRLGDSGAPDEQPARPTIIGRRNVTRVLTFYANGFRIDEGPLRTFDDPANEAFLSDVNRGIVPREMEQPGVGDVSITLVDKKDTDFVEKRPSVVPFSGGGQRLDGSNSTTTNNNTNSTNPTTSTVNVNAATATVIVDQNQPVARIQVRLSDGTRIVATLNQHHTVGHLRQFVQASRPTVTNFALATTFPRLVLSDDTATIKDAKLNGAVVVQTLK